MSSQSSVVHVACRVRARDVLMIEDYIEFVVVGDSKYHDH